MILSFWGPAYFQGPTVKLLGGVILKFNSTPASSKTELQRILSLQELEYHQLLNEPAPLNSHL